MHVDRSEARALATQIQKRAANYGAGFFLTAGAHDDECKRREVAREREQEEEQELQVAKLNPASESDWDY